MCALLIVSENYTNGYRLEGLDLISLFSILCGILVIISKNPIISVLYLIALFFSISCYLIILGINFIALSYLLVYVGAVSILFLFILMLINVRISELLSYTSNSIPLAIIIAAIFFNTTLYELLPYLLITTINSYMYKLNTLLNEISNIKSTNIIIKILKIFSDKVEIVFITSKTWEGALAETTHIASVGNIMYTSYLMWLIITSLILLLAMVGAIVITIKQKS